MGASDEGTGPASTGRPSRSIRHTCSGVSSSYDTPDGVIAISSPTRTDTLPDVPTVSPSPAMRRQRSTIAARAASSASTNSVSLVGRSLPVRGAGGGGKRSEYMVGLGAVPDLVLFLAAFTRVV